MIIQYTGYKLDGQITLMNEKYMLMLEMIFMVKLQLLLQTTV